MTTIGLLGATGYTGRLVAAELARRGLPTRLGGRDPDRLAAVHSSATAERFVCDVGQPERLRLFLTGLDAVISCVGPFGRYGDPVVDAAVEAGVPYVDSTGETTFMTGVYDRHGDAAVPVVPACGFDYLPGDLGAALAAEEAGGEVTDVVAGYLLHGVRPSRGTVRTAVDMMDKVVFAPRRLEVDFPEGRRVAITVPWGEEVTVPRFLPGARVRTGLVVATPVAYALGFAAPGLALTTPLRRLLRPVLSRLVERLPEAPRGEGDGDGDGVDDGDRPADAAAGNRLVVRAEGTQGSAGVAMTIGDPYRLTAALLVEAAVRVARPDCPPGALTPAQAFDPRSFLDAVSGPYLSWSLL